jgi:dTDP-4-amino-4,6-dideoxygalactose transaminase
VPDVPIPVPASDLRRRALRLAPAFHQAATRVVSAGRFVRGPELATLEDELASWSGRTHAVGVSSGAAALQLVLTGMGIGPGDEVIVPALGPVALATAVLAAGATPVLVDVDLATATLDPAAACGACTPATRAVLVHHTYGRPCERPPLDLPIVEDATHAPSAARRGADVVASVLSCHPAAPLGGVEDGGVVVTDDDGLADRLRRLRDHGRTELGIHVEVSQDFRLGEIGAAWLRVALRVLEPDGARRRAIAQRLRSLSGRLPWQDDHAQHDHHLLVLRAEERPVLQELLAAQGVGTSASWWPLALTGQPALRDQVRGPCPNAEAWAAGVTAVPAFPDLTDDEVTRVARVLAGVAL